MYNCVTRLALVGVVGAVAVLQSEGVAEDSAGTGVDEAGTGEGEAGSEAAEEGSAEIADREYDAAFVFVVCCSFVSLWCNDYGFQRHMKWLHR